MTAQDILDVLHEVKDAPALCAAEYEKYIREHPDGLLQLKHMPSHARSQRATRNLHFMLLNLPRRVEDLDPLPKGV